MNDRHTISPVQTTLRWWIACLAVLCLAGGRPAPLQGKADGLKPGTRVLLDAHNCYPYEGRWTDRIDRALSTGLPLAIEQDLFWYRDPATGVSRSVVAHQAPITGTEPSMEEYFFQKIRPLMEQALKEHRRDTWPLVVLNLDFKTNEPEHHRAVWELLGRYESWLSTAERRKSAASIAPIEAGPLLVLTGDPDAQEQSFHDAVPVGQRLRVFGAVHPAEPGTEPRKSNYRRWSNNPWKVVEPEGQPKAGAWDADDTRRLRDAVHAAHKAGLWIRFYTLDGFDPADTSGGWGESYNFGSRAAAEERWRAVIRAGVDFVAVDQYEDFAALARTVGR